jgi:hypothetical protein
VKLVLKKEKQVERYLQEVLLAAVPVYRGKEGFSTSGFLIGKGGWKT